MIKSSYIHEYAPHDQFMCESYYLLLESKDTLNDLIKLENIIAEKEYFGESVDNEILVLEAEKKNIFTRIGETIINIFNSFIDLLKDTGNAIKDALTGARKKSTDEKFANAMRNDPKLAEDFLKGVMSGNIKAHDVKDMNKLLDEATKITNDLMKGTIDKKTFGEKIEGALEKFASVAKNITAIVGVVGAVGGAVAAVDKLRDREPKAQRDAHRNAERERQRRKDIADEVSFGISLGNARRNNVITGAEAQDAANRYTATEASFDNISGDYITESVSFSDIFKKISAFFSAQIEFCTGAIKKLSDLKDDLLNKAKGAKDSEEGEVVNTALSGIRKVMGAISKELNTIKNTAKKVESECGA